MFFFIKIFLDYVLSNNVITPSSENIDASIKKKFQVFTADDYPLGSAKRIT